MTKPLAGSLCYVLGLTLVVAAILSQSWGVLLAASGVVLMLVGTGMIISSSGNRESDSTMRFDWFFPFKGRRTTDSPDRFASRIRKTLNRVGPSVGASPLRRVIQTACFLLFLVLFFYTCWPYTAAPAPPGQQVDGWELVAFDQQSGCISLRHERLSEAPFESGVMIHLVDQSVADQSQSAGHGGAFIWSAGSNDTVTLEPAGELAAEQYDRLVTSLGPWRISEDAPGKWPSHYADDLARKEFLPAELFLAIDPLVSLSTAIAARTWVWSLAAAGAILIVCLVIPRGFCGYVCPLGTLIDLFDWSIAGRVSRFRVSHDGWWVHLKYYLLVTTLVSAACGVLISGFVAAIPVVTRAFLFITEPLQVGTLRGWHLIPDVNYGHLLSIGLFLLILALGFLRPRFWCRYVCPSGAMFSLGNLFRLTERKVEASCIHCNKCVEICPFDAIKPDFTTRGTDCTFCQTCGGVCPPNAIKYVERWNLWQLKEADDPPNHETAIGRRGFLSWTAGTVVALSSAAGITAFANRQRKLVSTRDSALVPVRPPGSVPEPAFLQLCIRCGECFKACPNNVLQAVGWQWNGVGLWTPHVVADWAGCEASCNACGQVCPTGAIRALPLVEKQVARIGLAVVDQATCLPYANREECQLCVDECNAAGYQAIEFMRVHTQVDDQGMPLEGTGFSAPVVSAGKCVGCGLCQTRCYGINVKTKGLLAESAIRIVAGADREDRLMNGSYQALRAAERQRQQAEHQPVDENEFFVPEETDSTDEPNPSENPFG